MLHHDSTLEAMLPQGAVNYALFFWKTQKKVHHFVTKFPQCGHLPMLNFTNTTIFISKFKDSGLIYKDKLTFPSIHPRSNRAEEHQDAKVQRENNLQKILPYSPAPLTHAGYQKSIGTTQTQVWEFFQQLLGINNTAKLPSSTNISDGQLHFENQNSKEEIG
ncbi:hypothetical protein [Nostoc sp. FACHB-110]|uniref:hypothetical protein n=1 Tax=Nostoc sp. FACHB-110 TaxID=2692834 RepID=UPI0016847450|nr:hypothetical protein [Nostoc sp. FACHB-110]MBD2438814.1 hypothetical protein [Nostoc sp. FACHB-110]